MRTAPDQSLTSSPGPQSGAGSIADAIAHHEKMAAMYEADSDHLERRYGTGVRPGWVSADIAMNSAAARRHRAAADEWRAREPA